LLGLKALERAAAKVTENSRKNKYKIPVWKNGRIEYEIPAISTKQESEPDAKIFFYAKRSINIDILSRVDLKKLSAKSPR